MYKGILCNMASFKQHCAFGFWHQTMRDASERDGKSEEAMGQYGRLTSLRNLPKDSIIVGQIKEAMKLRDSGVKARPSPRPKVKAELKVPDYFTAALKKNKKALATFESFSYTNKKEYVEWVT